MKWILTYRIDGIFTTEVEADTLKEAVKKGDENFGNADFGEAHEVDAEPLMAENADNEVTYLE